ncbi:hypothetical protein A6R68_04699 [Neotoma lepida]|uniref:Uncharacterized protein n=1 Tax=Neotoma lepida TaxID=56216 RepID=A0A1A6GKG7_NEOLE|nr:hypothetical protein A6R68_04699 [Neotoma lepida]
MFLFGKQLRAKCDSGDDRKYARGADELKESNGPSVGIVERIGGRQWVEELEAPLDGRGHEQRLILRNTKER